jgi:ketosteroid isomerase-like protein
MRWFQGFALAAVLGISALAAGQDAAPKATPDLEKVLWDVNQQWLCSGPYQKPYKACVEFRSKYWVDQFFEIGRTGYVQDKTQMVAQQSAVDNPLGIGPHPDAFKLRAVYGDFALATDITSFTTLSPGGEHMFTSSAKVLRLFVKEKGEWRPAAAALVPVVMPPGSNPVVLPPAVHSDNPREKSSGWADTEKQLAAIDEKWLDSAMNKKLDYMGQLFADRWFEILGWDPTRDTVKQSTLKVLADANRKPGEGVAADEFKLRALYPNIALATDRRTRTWTDNSGGLMKTPHRSLLVFVKQNGQWKSAAAALVPISPKNEQ